MGIIEIQEGRSFKKTNNRPHNFKKGIILDENLPILVVWPQFSIKRRTTENMWHNNLWVLIPNYGGGCVIVAPREHCPLPALLVAAMLLFLEAAIHTYCLSCAWFRQWWWWFGTKINYKSVTSFCCFLFLTMIIHPFFDWSLKRW